MRSLTLSQWRDSRMGVICVDLGALTTNLNPQTFEAKVKIIGPEAKFTFKPYGQSRNAVHLRA